MRNAQKDAIEMARKRKCLLEAGFRLFSERTIEAVKLADVAKAAGVSVITLFRYFKTKPDLVIEIGAGVWRDYYAEVERAYAKRGGESLDAAGELEFFLDCIAGLYRDRRDVLRFNRNFDTYVQHEHCTAEQMRPYNEVVDAFAARFRAVGRKARKDGTLDLRVADGRTFVRLLSITLSAAGKYAEGLVYPPGGPETDHSADLLLLKRMILAFFAPKPAARRPAALGKR